MEARDIAIRTAHALIGTPYKWGGSNPVEGFDCSGLIIWILQEAKILGMGFDTTAHGLLNRYPYARDPGRGILAFRMNSLRRASHVGICIDSESVIEAGGGGRNILTYEDAIRNRAFVRIREIWGNAVFADPFHEG